MNLPVHGNRHFRGYDVIFGICIVGRVQAKKVLIGLADHVGMKWTESSIRAGIAKVERELPGLHLNRDRVCRRRREINGSPCFDPENTEGQNLGSYQEKRRPDQSLGAAREGLYLVTGTPTGKFPDEQSQQNLRSQERNSSLGHRL